MPRTRFRPPGCPEPIPGAWALPDRQPCRQVREPPCRQPRRWLIRDDSHERSASAPTWLRQTLGAHAGPPTSLNRPVLAGRRVRFLRLDLSAVKRAGHAPITERSTMSCSTCGREGCGSCCWPAGSSSRGSSWSAVKPCRCARASTDRSITRSGRSSVPLPVWESRTRSVGSTLIVQRTHRREAANVCRDHAHPGRPVGASRSRGPAAVASAPSTSGSRRCRSTPAGVHLRGPDPRDPADPSPLRQRRAGLVRVLLRRADLPGRDGRCCPFP